MINVGGSSAQGSQGKQNDIQFYTLNWMVEQANKNIPSLNEGQVLFNAPPANQQPSANLIDLMNFYLESKQNNDLSNMDAAKTLLNQKYIHSEDFTLTTPWNYKIGSQRGIFYQND